MNNYFKIFESCIPVRGVSRSTICDMQRNVIRFIPNDFYDLLMKFEDCSFEDILNHYGEEHKETITEYFDFMIEHEFGFWCDDLTLFPKIDTDWDSPSAIENGIIDVNSNSKHDYKEIFRQYEALGCNALEIRFYDLVSLKELSSILSLLLRSRIAGVEILIPYNESMKVADLKGLMKEYLRLTNISIHSTPPDAINEFKQEHNIYCFETPITSHSHCGNIGMKYFSVNQDTFFESQNYNSCLNKKISIDVNGDIKNCPSMKGGFGNINNDLLKDVLDRTHIKEPWGIHKEQIDTCKVCEFRHVCTDCRAFLDSDTSKEKPAKCNYDPVAMEWG